MPTRALPSLALILFICLTFVLPLPAASQERDSTLIHLRRATFDPLQRAPALTSSLRSTNSTTLLLAQVNGSVDSTTEERLRAAGLEPLAYVPDNTFVVRAQDGARTASRTAWLRWTGPFEPSFKLAADLDAALSSRNATLEELNLTATSDADVAALTAAIQTAGGAVLDRSESMNGITLRLQLPGGGLRTLLNRDDVVWIERHMPMQLHNQEGRNITEVNTARERVPWLTGAGQIVAVTDTGLDNQANVSRDFAGRVVRGFTKQEMNPANSNCTSDWSDYNSHGTHVAGTVLGNGANSNGRFAGMAPEARLVVQSVSSGGPALDCLSNDISFLSKAYEAGARIQNASWGGPTSGTMANPQFGGYTSLSRAVDEFLWQHPDHLLVVSAGNDAVDADRNGVIDYDSIGSPATAKNVLTVGASESQMMSGGYNPGGYCSTWGTCWTNDYGTPPLSNDRISDKPNGMAAFSSRGPTDDGRIKPEIVAPGTNIISARSQAAPNSGVTGWGPYDQYYLFNGGTSMSAPMVSGLAALTRQWLVQSHGVSTPSAALVKSLLLNGATNMGPGQYDTGATREIPEAWPNNVQGWGRANILNTIGENGVGGVWFVDERNGLSTGQVSEHTLKVVAGQPLRVTLAWTDFPAATFASRTLINNLDLELLTPDGGLVRGNRTAELDSRCRAANGADTCNNVETIEIANPVAGTYTLRVRATAVPQGDQQPFALVAGGGTARPEVAQLQASVSNAAITLNWSGSNRPTRYEVEQSSSTTFASITARHAIQQSQLTLVADVGTHSFRVRGCSGSVCGDFSDSVTVTVTTPPQKLFAPMVGR